MILAKTPGARLRRVLALLVTLGLFSHAFAARAQDAALPQLPPHSAPVQQVQMGTLPVLDTTPSFDADAATAAYLAKVSGPARMRSDAHADGGYWLMLVNLIYGLTVAGLVLWLQIAARIRDWAGEATRSRTGQVMICTACFVAIAAAAAFPLLAYECFFRARAYQLSHQTFLQWSGDFAIGLALAMAAALVVLPVFYAATRRTGQAWWIWGAGIAAVALAAALVLYPVAVAPLFNRYTPLPDSPLKKDILSLARANGVPADNVWQVDASRRSDRISAHIAGLAGSARIVLDDNLLNRCTHDEVMAVVGRQIGQYVLGRATRLAMLLGLVMVAGFAFMAWGFAWSAGLFGGNWQVREATDVAGLPLLAAWGMIFLFLATPVINGIVRTGERQADIFGVNAVRKPDAFASVTLKRAPWQKLEPGPWEEAIFYDHPSGRSRIHAMMVWKKEHIGDLDIRETANLP